MVNTHPLAAAEEVSLEDAPPPYESLIFEKPEPGTEKLVRLKKKITCFLKYSLSS